MRILRLVLLLNLGVQSALCFYVPGVAPTDFNEGDRIDVRAVKMSSSQTQLPFEYYSLDFCKDKEHSVNSVTIILNIIIKHNCQLIKI